MTVARFLHPETNQACLGMVMDQQVIDFRAAWALGISDAEIHPTYNDTLFANLENGALASLAEAMASGITAPSELAHSLVDVSLLPPVDARSLRDFYAFEAHVKHARRNRGLEMIPEWYERPVFYFSNTAGIVGHDALVRRPSGTEALDYELEIAAIIGREGADIPAEHADDYIAGFTIFNDWSARDWQRHEMKVGLGPCKGKDFASSLGPWLVTPDGLPTRRNRDRSVRPEAVGLTYDLAMTARVNGREISRGSSADMRWTFAELIAEASRNTRLLPGDVIGSGTVGTGCITEFSPGTVPWLEPGDVVELEVEGLGVLRNKVE